MSDNAEHTDASINEMGARSRFRRELDHRDVESRGRKPGPPGAANNPAEPSPNPRPLTGSEAVDV